jgi:tetratricopeptide (TPR) repeat protein
MTTESEDERTSDEFLARFRRAPDAPRPEWAFKGENILREMDEVPLFMTDVPENVGEIPALAALQSLLYDDGTPEEVAANFKAQGNEAYKLGPSGYADAIKFYGQGLEQRCADAGLNALLHLNRAAVHLARGNHGKAMVDCEEAIGLSPEDKNVLEKGHLRAAKACMQLDRLPEALDHLDKSGLDTEEAARLRKDIGHQLGIKQRLERERESRRKVDAKIDRILGARGVTRVVDTPHERDVLGMLGPGCDPSRLPCVTFAPKSATRLVWPLLLLYPPYGQSDFLSAADETAVVADHLGTVFSQHAPWDTEHLYDDASKLKVYYLVGQDHAIYELPAKRTRIVDVLGRLVTEVDRGLLALHIVPEGRTDTFLARFPAKPTVFQP